MTTTEAFTRYNEVKREHPDAIILIRFGDFYETYREDADICAKELGITITWSRGSRFTLAGFPHYNLDTYLPRLIRAGHRVIITD